MPAPGPAPCCAAPQGMEEGGDKRRVDAGEDEAELDELSPTEALLEVSTHSPALTQLIHTHLTHPHQKNRGPLPLSARPPALVPLTALLALPLRPLVSLPFPSKPLPSPSGSPYTPPSLPTCLR